MKFEMGHGDKGMGNGTWRHGDGEKRGVSSFAILLFWAWRMLTVHGITSLKDEGLPA